MISNKQIDSLMNDSQTKQNIFTEDFADNLIDNYFNYLSVYRSIIKEEKKAHNEISKIRSIGKKELDRIRLQEENRIQNKQFLTEKEKIELQEEKDYYNYLLEFDESKLIEKNGEILQSTPIIEMILNNRKFFEKIEHIDRKLRSKFGFLAKKAIQITLWPMIKMTNYTKKVNSSKTGSTILEETSNIIDDLDSRIEDYIKNPA